MDLLKRSYDSSQVVVGAYIPKIDEVKDINQIEVILTECSLYMKKTESFYLKNAYQFGDWLQMAFKLFRHEKYVVRNPRLPATFEKWLKNINISKKQFYTYKNLRKLIVVAPKLINCRVTVKFLIERYMILIAYFKNNNDDIWSHEVNCECQNCIEYFN